MAGNSCPPFVIAGESDGCRTACPPPIEPRARSRTWLRRILLTVGIVLALVILLPLAWAVGDAFFGSNARNVTNVEYTDAAGNTLVGYLAQPAGDGPHPSVLLLHEWWGLTKEITVLADALAREGYVVFAPDAYRGRVGRLGAGCALAAADHPRHSDPRRPGQRPHLPAQPAGGRPNPRRQHGLLLRGRAVPAAQPAPAGEPGGHGDVLRQRRDGARVLRPWPTTASRCWGSSGRRTTRSPWRRCSSLPRRWTAWGSKTR